MDNHNGRGLQNMFDLAILTQGGLKKVGKKVLDEHYDSNMTRTELVSALRTAGYDRYYCWPSREGSEEEQRNAREELASLREVVKDLRKLVSHLLDQSTAVSAISLQSSNSNGAKVTDVDVVETANTPAADQPSEIENDSKPTPTASTNSSKSSSCGTNSVENARGENRPPALYAAVAQTPALIPRRTHVLPADKYSILASRRAQRGSSRTSASTSAQPRKPLSGAKKISRAVFFVGNLDLDSTVDDIVAHCASKKVTVTDCSLFYSKTHFGTYSARLTIDSSGSGKVVEPDFWPDDVKARKWIFNSTSEQQ